MAAAQMTPEASSAVSTATSLYRPNIFARWLPIELSDMVVDCLDDLDDGETLKTSCLVSKAWRQRIQPVLFEIVVVTFSKEKPISLILGFMEKIRPDLFQYTCSVKIRAMASESHDTVSRVGTLRKRVLARMLSAMPRLQELDIEDVRWVPDIEKESSELYHTSRYSLECLTLEDVRFGSSTRGLGEAFSHEQELNSLLSLFRRIDILDIYDPHFPGKDAQSLAYATLRETMDGLAFPAGIAKPPTELRLRNDSCNGPLPLYIMLYNSHWRMIETLEVSVMGRDIGLAIEDILRDIGEQLKVLKFDFYGDTIASVDAEFYAPALSPCESLYRLEITVMLGNPALFRDGSTMLRLIAKLLKTAPGSLRQLFIALDITTEEGKEPPLVAPSEDWTDLDAALKHLTQRNQGLVMGFLMTSTLPSFGSPVPVPVQQMLLQELKLNLPRGLEKGFKYSFTPDANPLDVLGG
ncbi:hypothetical protein EIP91_007437 [Steccherinum ochraceum]|uniref:F-box domain-containing protein n=1 Tax=Steccherinum ochraceum TaxID=92696 RepID=A0A4V2MXB6_9APHY|nr:hypothetical protein EIP91_007437 [Steccherinum ochraceum]